MRRYASEAPKSGGNNTILYGLVGAGALGGGYYYYSRNQNPHGQKQESAAHGQPASSKEEGNIPGQAAAGVKVFTGGDQGFIPLTLDKVENINENTKLFRFKFESDDAVSGLAVASALLTKYKGPNMEKPAIRPYTPVSDEGTLRDLEQNTAELTFL